MRLHPTALVLFGGLSLTGCLAGRGETDLLHARLREQDQRLAEVQSLITDKEQALAEARREADALRQQLAQSSGGRLLPEQSDQLVRVSGIKIHSLLTAGVDRDEVAGDDALFVQFAPHDADGEIVKLPGNIDIAVFDPLLPDGERTVAQWSFTPEECRQHWTRGFVGTGYQFTLPWPGDPPQHSELVVHVRLKPVDGREFTATHVIRISPPVVTTEAQQTTFKPAGPIEREPLVESTNWTELNTPVRR